MQRPPAGSVIAVVLGFGVYLGYIGLCFGMEPLARSRYPGRMYEWGPYIGYLIIVGAAIVGGTAGAGWIAWKRRASLTVMLLSMLVALTLFAAPFLAARI